MGWMLLSESLWSCSVDWQEAPQSSEQQLLRRQRALGVESVSPLRPQKYPGGVHGVVREKARAESLC